MRSLLARRVPALVLARRRPRDRSTFRRSRVSTTPPEATPADVDAAFDRIKDLVSAPYGLREAQVELREPKLYDKWEEWEDSDEGRSWRYNYG